jgi:hypothetical protein
MHYFIHLIVSLLCPYFLLNSYFHYFILCEFIPYPPYFTSFFALRFFMFFSLYHLTSERVILVTCYSRNVNFIGTVVWCGFRVFWYCHVVVSSISLLLFDASHCS